MMTSIEAPISESSSSGLVTLKQTKVSHLNFNDDLHDQYDDDIDIDNFDDGIEYDAQGNAIFAKKSSLLRTSLSSKKKRRSSLGLLSGSKINRRKSLAPNNPLPSYHQPLTEDEQERLAEMYKTVIQMANESNPVCYKTIFLTFLQSIYLSYFIHSLSSISYLFLSFLILYRVLNFKIKLGKWILLI